MNNDFTVIETRLQEDGSVRHVVQAPGGNVVVTEDDAGNLTGRVRSGYVATAEEEDDPLDRAFGIGAPTPSRSKIGEGD